MSEFYLSDVFKFTQGLGQKGHQIGRKVGDAIELVTLAMIYKEPSLTNFLVIEDGVEGATSAKHKVEFAFYNLNAENQPQRNSENLFGIIECKKVGVEQTVKQNFKEWNSIPANKASFHQTNGYSFTISPPKTNLKWLILVKATTDNPNNLSVTIRKVVNGLISENLVYNFNCLERTQILIVQDIADELFILGPDQILSEVERSIKKCVILQIKDVNNGQIESIHVNESLPGPQTPEKAK